MSDDWRFHERPYDLRERLFQFAKRKISLREVKETRFRLRVLRKCELLTPDQDPVIEESNELVKILATLVRNSDGSK